jgi:hypothetical protein
VAVSRCARCLSSFRLPVHCIKKLNNSIPAYDRFHSHAVPDIHTALASVDDILEIGPESWMLGMEEVRTGAVARSNVT